MLVCLRRNIKYLAPQSRNKRMKIEKFILFIILFPITIVVMFISIFDKHMFMPDSLMSKWATIFFDD